MKRNEIIQRERNKAPPAKTGIFLAEYKKSKLTKAGFGGLGQIRENVKNLDFFKENEVGKTCAKSDDCMKECLCELTTKTCQYEHGVGAFYRRNLEPNRGTFSIKFPSELARIQTQMALTLPQVAEESEDTPNWHF